MSSALVSLGAFPLATLIPALLISTSRCPTSSLMATAAAACAIVDAAVSVPVADTNRPHSAA